MAPSRTRLRYPLLPVLLLATALVASGCAPAALAAQTQEAGRRSITVAGQGSATAKPDLAVVQLGIETVAATVGEATQDNNTKMAAIVAKLAELNIADKDIQTSNLSIGMDYSPEKGGPNPNQYRVSNMVQVKVRDVSRVGAVLDGVIEAGANQVYGISFTVDKPEALQDEARVKAVEDAARRAEALAKLTNLQVGQVLTISEVMMTSPLPGGGGFMYGKGAAGDSGISVSPGEVEITYQVQVTYAIE